MESVLVSSAKAGYKVFPSYSAYNGLSFAIYGENKAIITNANNKYKLTNAILFFLNWVQAYFLNEKF